MYIFYLPAGATLEMGPTVIIPQSQWLGRDQGESVNTDWSSVAKDPTSLAPSLTEHLCTAPANQGTAVLLHHAMFHRGSVSVRDPERRAGPDNPRRPMIKLIFHRTLAPTRPSWDHDPGFAFGGDEQVSARMAAAAGCTELELTPAIESVWRWLTGTTQQLASSDGVGAGGLGRFMSNRLSEQLLRPQREGDEAARVGSGYRLARAASANAAQRLLHVLEHGPEAGRRVAVQALAAAGAAAVGPLVARIHQLSAGLTGQPWAVWSFSRAPIYSSSDSPRKANWGA